VWQRLLPSASQRVLSSPEVGAMAERFIEADEQASKLRQGNDAKEREQQEDESVLGRGHLGEPLDAVSEMDEVNDVLSHFDELLNVWDLEAELDQARQAPRQEREASGLTQPVGSRP